MANLHAYFKKFYGSLQIVSSKKAAITKSHNAVRELVKAKFNEKHPEFMLRFWIQGSWKMGTTIRTKDDECDLDDGVYITPEPDVTSTTVKDWVEEAVESATKGGTQHKNKCIRVMYASGYHVDLPVYVKASFDKDWEHPKLATRDNGYIESDPKELVGWFNGKKRNNEQLVRIISYMKAWSDNAAITMPPGLALTILAANNQVKNERDDVALLETLKAIRMSLNNRFVCIVPATPHDDVLSNFREKKDRILEEFDKIIKYGENAINEKNPLKASRYWIHALGDRFPEAENIENPDVRLNELRNLSNQILSGSAKIDRTGHIQTGNGITNQPHRFYGEE